MVRTVGLVIRPHQHDVIRWKKITTGADDDKTATRISIRVYPSDKLRWHRIIKIQAVKDKRAADVFGEMIDLYERYSRGVKKKSADVFREMLNLFERQMLLWGD